MRSSIVEKGTILMQEQSEFLLRQMLYFVSQARFGDLPIDVLQTSGIDGNI